MNALFSFSFLFRLLVRLADCWKRTNQGDDTNGALRRVGNVSAVFLNPFPPFRITRHAVQCDFCECYIVWFFNTIFGLSSVSQDDEHTFPLQGLNTPIIISTQITPTTVWADPQPPPYFRSPALFSLCGVTSTGRPWGPFLDPRTCVASDQ